MRAVDYVAIILTICLCGIMAGIFVQYWIDDMHPDGSNLESLENVLTGMLSIVAMYVGSQLRGRGL